jgi:hypothetical protein
METKLMKTSVRQILTALSLTVLTTASHAGLDLLPGVVGVEGGKALVYESVGSTRGELRVSFRSLKSRYKVNESVKFKVKSNKRVYLYLLNIDEKNNTAFLLLPNGKQRNNLYEKGEHYVVPRKNVKFYSPKAGTERVIAVASTRQIPAFDLRRFTRSGDFYKSTANHGLSITKNLQIGTHGHSNHSKRNISLTDISFDVVSDYVEEENVFDDYDDRAQPFISTHKTSFHRNDRARVTYGANKRGWVYLFSRDSGGRIDFVKNQKVQSGKTYAMTVGFEDRGKQSVIAVYTKSRSDKYDIQAALEYTEEKRMTLRDEGTLNYSEYTFYVD